MWIFHFFDREKNVFQEVKNQAYFIAYLEVSDHNKINKVCEFFTFFDREKNIFQEVKKSSIFYCILKVSGQLKVNKVSAFLLFVSTSVLGYLFFYMLKMTGSRRYIKIGKNPNPDTILETIRITRRTVEYTPMHGQTRWYSSIYFEIYWWHCFEWSLEAKQNSEYGINACRYYHSALYCYYAWNVVRVCVYSTFKSQTLQIFVLFCIISSPEL